MSTIITEEIFQKNTTTMADFSISLSRSMQSELCIVHIFDTWIFFFLVMHRIVVTDSSQTRIHVSSLFRQGCPVALSIEQRRSKPLPRTGNAAESTTSTSVSSGDAPTGTDLKGKAVLRSGHPNALRLRGFLWHQLPRGPRTEHPVAPAGHRARRRNAALLGEPPPCAPKPPSDAPSSSAGTAVIQTHASEGLSWPEPNATALVKTRELHLRVRAVPTAGREHGAFHKDLSRVQPRGQDLTLRSYHTMNGIPVIWAVCCKGQEKGQPKEGKNKQKLARQMRNEHLICALTIGTSGRPQVAKITVWWGGAQRHTVPRGQRATEGPRNGGNRGHTQFVLPGGFNLLHYFLFVVGGCVDAFRSLLWSFLNRYLQVICMGVY